MIGEKAIETSFCEAVHGDAHDFGLYQEFCGAISKVCRELNKVVQRPFAWTCSFFAGSAFPGLVGGRVQKCEDSHV